MLPHSPNRSSTHSSPSPGLILRIVLPFAYGYFLAFMIRTVNAAISTDLQSELGLTADALGLLTSTFFLSFALMQIPLGLLMDRYGPRRVEAVLLLIASLGCLLFGLGNHISVLAIGRLMMGVGMSACLMAAFTTINHWFDRTRVPSMNAFIAFGGGLGAIFAADPVVWISQQWGWRSVFYILAAATLLSSLLIYWIVPSRESPAATQSPRAAIRGIIQVFTSRYFWLISMMSLGTQASFGAMAGLWTGPWLRDVGNLAQDEVALALRWIAIAMTAGFLLIGNIASFLARKGMAFWRITFSFMCLFWLTQPILLLPFGWWSIAAWMAFAFFGTSGILAFALLTQHFDHQLAGRVNSALNLLIFVLSFIVQWGVGLIIQQWPEIGDGRYPTVAYQCAIMVIAIPQAVALMVFWRLRRLASYGYPATD